MKKIKLLIPTLLTVTTASAMSVISCNNETITYEATAEEREQAIGLKGIGYMQWHREGIMHVGSSYDIDATWEFTPNVFHAIDKVKLQTQTQFSITEQYVIKYTLAEKSEYVLYIRDGQSVEWRIIQLTTESSFETPEEQGEDYFMPKYIEPIEMGLEYIYDKEEKCYSIQYEKGVNGSVNQSFYFVNKKLVGCKIQSPSQTTTETITYNEIVPPLPPPPKRM